MGRSPRATEGLRDLTWVLMDYGDFLVHVFQDEARAYYDLEQLWGDAPRRRLPVRAAPARRRLSRRPGWRRNLGEPPAEACQATALLDGAKDGELRRAWPRRPGRRSPPAPPRAGPPARRRPR